MGKQPWMVVIAGPNGAGKSTFYDKVLKTDPLFKDAAYINLDNIARIMADDAEEKDPNKYIISAGKKVMGILGEKISNKRTFIYETTSSGNNHLKLIDNAKKNGFKIATIFIGLSDVAISHARVQQRVTEGGHSVSAEDIDRRFPRVLENFPEMLKRSDVSTVFDNSKKPAFRLIFLMDESKFFIFHEYPKWVNTSLKERKTSKDMIHISNKSLRKMPTDKVMNIMNCVFEQINHNKDTRD